VNPTDLTATEQTNVRTALRFLRARCGGWQPLARALRFKATYLAKVGTERVPSASMALRIARLAQVGVDELLAGKYPPAGTCPHCGLNRGESA
jgi:hypothetical protein